MALLPMWTEKKVQEVHKSNHCSNPHIICIFKPTQFFSDQILLIPFEPSLTLSYNYEIMLITEKFWCSGTFHLKLANFLVIYSNSVNVKFTLSNSSTIKQLINGSVIFVNIKLFCLILLPYISGVFKEALGKLPFIRSIK